MENVALNEKTMADLRKHHFNLGYLGYDTLTEYHENYDNKHKPRSKKEKDELKARKTFLSQHNFSLGRSNSLYNTSYGKEFYTKKSNLRKERKIVKKHVETLRASKISLGTMGRHMRKKNKEDYNDKTEFRDPATE